MDTRTLIRAAALAGLLATATVPALAQKRLTACDVLDEPLAVAILGAAIEERSPPPPVEQAGKAFTSWCYFGASNSNVRAQLLEFPNASVATGTVQQLVSRKGGPAYAPEKGLGQEAWWWSMADEKARGFVLRKGARILVIDVRSAASVGEKQAKEFLRPRMKALAARI
ncbi:MAG: hypothetical protein ABW051_06695 [Burkholderiaceae bacterium]